jgi:hypothetical protein
LNEESFEKKMKLNSQDTEGDRGKIIMVLSFIAHPLESPSRQTIKEKLDVFTR